VGGLESRLPKNITVGLKLIIFPVISYFPLIATSPERQNAVELPSPGINGDMFPITDGYLRSISMVDCQSNMLLPEVLIQPLPRHLNE
jgi:hypothetical protein